MEIPPVDLLLLCARFKLHWLYFFSDARACILYFPLLVMADTHTKMGNDLSSNEEEARHQAFKDVRTRAFFKQGFEAGMEVASEEVVVPGLVDLLSVIL